MDDPLAHQSGEGQRQGVGREGEGDVVDAEGHRIDAVSVFPQDVGHGDAVDHSDEADQDCLLYTSDVYKRQEIASGGGLFFCAKVWRRQILGRIRGNGRHPAAEKAKW